jgi:hypothetical protein
MLQYFPRGSNNLGGYGEPRAGDASTAVAKQL